MQCMQPCSMGLSLALPNHDIGKYQKRNIFVWQELWIQTNALTRVAKGHFKLATHFFLGQSQIIFRSRLAFATRFRSSQAFFGMTLFYRWLRAVSLGTLPHLVIGSPVVITSSESPHKRQTVRLCVRHLAEDCDQERRKRDCGFL